MHSNVSTNTNMKAEGNSSSLSCVSMGVVNSAPELDMAASYSWCTFFSLTPTSCACLVI